MSPVLPGPMWRHTDYPIHVAGHMIPPHTELGAMRYNIFRNPDLFHRADEFLPQRWMEREGVFRDDDLEANQPFGLGPRTCIGRNIAWMELRLIVAKFCGILIGRGVQASGIVRNIWFFIGERCG